MAITYSPQVVGLLSEIERARYLPPGRHRDTSYDVRDVDRFFEGLAFAARGGVPVLPQIEEHRFLVVAKGHNGYGIEAVDRLLARVRAVAEPADDAARTVAKVPHNLMRRRLFTGRVARVGAFVVAPLFLIVLGVVLGAM